MEALGGKGGGGGKVKTTEYLYYASFAVALCEGPITGIGRVWADGKAMDMTGVTWRMRLESLVSVLPIGVVVMIAPPKMDGIPSAMTVTTDCPARCASLQVAVTASTGALPNGSNSNRSRMRPFGNSN